MTVEIRPTLVIGIGGTGGDIAELLYEDGERLGLVERRLLSVISLDTDDNDHRKRRLKETHKVRFSKASRIADLMRDNPDAAGTAIGCAAGSIRSFPISISATPTPGVTRSKTRCVGRNGSGSTGSGLTRSSTSKRRG